MMPLDAYDKFALVYAIAIFLMLIICCLSYILIFIGLVIGNNDMAIKALMVNVPTILMIIMMFLIVECLVRN